MLIGCIIAFAIGTALGCVIEAYCLKPDNLKQYQEVSERLIQKKDDTWEMAKRIREAKLRQLNGEPEPVYDDEDDETNEESEENETVSETEEI